MHSDNANTEDIPRYKPQEYCNLLFRIEAPSSKVSSWVENVLQSDFAAKKLVALDGLLVELSQVRR